MVGFLMALLLSCLGIEAPPHYEHYEVACHQVGDNLYNCDGHRL